MRMFSLGPIGKNSEPTPPGLKIYHIKLHSPNLHPSKWYQIPIDGLQVRGTCLPKPLNLGPTKQLEQKMQ